MAIDISVDKKEEIKEEIDVTSIVRSNKNPNDIYMFIQTQNGYYALLNLRTGLCSYTNKYKYELISLHEVELVTNEISMVLKNPKVDIKVGEE